MELPAGETELGDIRVGFDRRLKLEFHGSHITSDAGLLPFRDLDDALGLTEIAATALSDIRIGKNGRHSLIAQFRQSLFGRVAGYEDVNDADRLAKDPAMRWIVGGRAIANHAASTSQMARFETEVLTQNENMSALTDLSGQWIDMARSSRLTKTVVLDMDSSLSPTHDTQRTPPESRNLNEKTNSVFSNNSAIITNRENYEDKNPGTILISNLTSNTCLSLAVQAISQNWQIIGLM
jgi:hypothetical protein